MKHWPVCVAMMIACVLTSAPALGSGAPVVLKPNSKWWLEYSDDSCTLRRMFGEGKHRTDLELRRFAPGDESIQAMVMSSGWRARQRPASYRIEPATEWEKIQHPLYATAKNGFSGVVFSLKMLPYQVVEGEFAAGIVDSSRKAKFDAAFESATGITIEGVFSDEITLSTGSLAAVHQAMEQCLDELLTHWNIDAEAHKTLTRRAAPRSRNALERWVAHTYPLTLSVNGMPGFVPLRLDIDATGQVTGCHTQDDLSHQKFQGTVCKRLMGFDKFQPALDKNGNPIASYYTVVIQYIP